MKPEYDDSATGEHCQLKAGVRLLNAVEADGNDRRTRGSGFDRIRLGRREIVYSMDDLAPGVYVIESGRVKIYRLSEDGREIILNILGEGALFGEECLIDGEHHDSFAETIEPTELTFIARGIVRRRLEQDPALGMTLFEIVGARLRAAHKLAESLAFDAVPSRVANLLLELTGETDPIGGETVTLNTGLTHQQMAGLIGTTRETFTSTISRLAASRIVRTQRRRLEILDIGALHRIA